MPFNYGIPKSQWKPTVPALRGPDGQIVPTFTKVRNHSRKSSLGDRNRRHITVKVADGVEYTLHATKGWRERKA